MNKKRFEDSVSIAVESEHKLIGLKYFKWHFNVVDRRLDIYYKDQLLESYEGQDAIDLHKQFNDEITMPKHLTESEVKRISENICRLSEDETKKRDMYRVFSRWLFYHYFKYFTDYSLQSIGNCHNQDHATVLHGLKQIKNPYLGDWRLNLKIRFMNEINRVHESAGIIKKFRL